MTKKINKKRKKVEKKTLWVALVIFVVLILIILVGYFVRVYLSNGYYNYEGKNGEYKIWKSKVGSVIFYHVSVFQEDQEYIYSFRNHPKDLEEIYLEPGLISELNRPKGIRKLYVTQDVELANMTDADSVLGIAAFEQMLTGNFGIYNLDISNVYNTSFENKTLPITCANVTNNIAVVYIKVGDETKVYSQYGCIIIEGRGGNGIIKAGEKFAYNLLGVF
ncbi:hypothetical protein J4230_01880 [Candidatus Woesearchaeota archaeon]|nr:hypothetical protein [Candidatus Woesearchaeota archaeon]